MSTLVWSIVCKKFNECVLGNNYEYDILQHNPLHKFAVDLLRVCVCEYTSLHLPP